jgi:single-strand DNA-binding protein
MYEGVKEHMGSVNEVTLVGNLTRDPEMKHTEGKQSPCILGLATNRTWTDENGKKHEEPEFHRIVAWGKLAETCHQFLRKGRQIYVRGRLHYRTYTGQDGMEKFSAEIVLEKMEMLDSMPEDVRQRMELEDALADTSNGAPAPQV